MVVSITAFRDIAAGETLLNTVSGIDATATATTNLYTVPGGQTVVVTKVVLRVTAIDTLTVDPVGGVGIAAGEQDIFFPQTITGLTAIGDTWTFDAAAQAVDASAAEIIKLGLDTLATATTLTLAADIFGYFVGSAPVQLASAATAAVVTNSAPVSLTHNVWTPLTWNTERFDDSAFHDNSVNPDRLTAPSNGLYRFDLTVAFVAAGGANRAIRMLKNGVATPLGYAQGPPVSGQPTALTTWFVDRLTGGDYFTAGAFHDSGGALNTEETITFFSITRLGD